MSKDTIFLNEKIHNGIMVNSEYDFLKENPYLNENICLLAYGGSIAYGTNLPTSDVDIRGIAINPLHELFDLRRDFEQVVDTTTDTTIYSLLKMNQLLIKSNPNTIEILGCKPEHYLYSNFCGDLILANANNYLSMAAIDSFGGYARAQFNRLEHGLLGNGANDDKKLAMLKHSLECTLEAFNIKHSNELLNLNLEIEKINKKNELNVFENMDSEKEGIVISGSFNKYPLSSIKVVLNELHKVDSEYGNINKRNTKKTDIKLSKHMMHLIRLYLMATKLNKECKIQTYWDGEQHDMLMKIRLGEYISGDGLKVHSSFYDLLHQIQEEYEYSVKYTTLPEKPNIDALMNMMQEIFKHVLNKK